MATLQQAFAQVEVVRLHFSYRFQRPVRIPHRHELTLRPLLHRIGQEQLDPLTCDRLFTPALSGDPTAQRRYQRPSPPFVLQPAERRNGTPTEHFTLQLHLFGSGIELLDPLASVLQGLAEEGALLRHTGATLCRIEAEESSGGRTLLWRNGTPLTCAPPPRTLPDWLFDTPIDSALTLQLLTPARLISRGKPLFAPSFRKILPFVARRVTSMLHTWCDIEIDQIPDLLETAETIAAETELRWEDWKDLAGGEGFGGVIGQVRFPAGLPDDVLRLLQLGSLMNIGKGASYGAGAYRVV